MNYYISDLHFGHKNVIRFDNRPFKDVDEMDAELIRLWNSKVSNDDHVYIIGDLCFRNGIQEQWYIRQLKGHKHLIIGNHDSDKRLERYIEENIFESIQYATVLKYKHYIFYLSHYPTLCSNYDIDKPLKERTINLCGHTHTDNKFIDMKLGLIYHCELDAHNCKPVLIDDIITDIRIYLKENII